MPTLCSVVRDFGGGNSSGTLHLGWSNQSPSDIIGTFRESTSDVLVAHSRQDNDSVAHHPNDGEIPPPPPQVLNGSCINVVNNVAGPPEGNPGSFADIPEDNDYSEYGWGEIEGVADLNDKGLHHMTAFYVILKQLMAKKEVLSSLFLKKKYDIITNFCVDLMNGDDCRTKFLDGYKQASKWANRYDTVVVGKNSLVLVYHPEKSAVDVQALCLDVLCQLSYGKRAFADLLAIHKSDHCKGTTFLKPVKARHGNITREICKVFTDCCPHCIKLLHRFKPKAGVKNMVTDGFGVRGQVDLIDFQSMLDGAFCYLLNYIDHGIKKLTSTPITAKQATSTALALFNIFTEQGPLLVLQTDNGGEFVGSANNHVGQPMLLNDEVILLPQ